MPARLALTLPYRIPIQVSGSRSDLRRTQQNIRTNLQFFEIDVRLIEAVEEDESVGAGVIETLRHVREVAEERAQFHRDRNRHGRSSPRARCRDTLFNIRGRQLGIGRDVIDVALDRVGARALDLEPRTSSILRASTH